MSDGSNPEPTEEDKQIARYQKIALAAMGVSFHYATKSNELPQAMKKMDDAINDNAAYNLVAHIQRDGWEKVFGDDEDE